MKKKILGVLLAGVMMALPMEVKAEDKVIEFSYEEAQELMQIAWCEAGNQGADGQKFIMSVVLNRVASPDWPDTIHDVIYQPHQFATGRMKKAELTPETHEALAEIEKGNGAPEIIAFETTRSNSLDKYFDVAFDYRDHIFYTKKH